MPRDLKKVRKFKAGYELRYERWWGDDAGGGLPFILVSAFSPAGNYIGNSKVAHRLVVTRGIIPQLSRPDHKVCSVGFCNKEMKWYGWSHRAIWGFKVGDVIKEGDCAASSGFTEEYLAGHPGEDMSLPIGFTAKDLDDCKRMAIAFAESVG
ncbi:hypothetical protein LCGC14_2809290 [marine sediment metagenome]|uniref:Uncharacterized protein n=1 Tax=marine sediment metagenome TaxID=412755 RepID=A0A0F8YKE9_9ZZZZ